MALVGFQKGCCPDENSLPALSQGEHKHYSPP
jgi:hypothetical protein